MSRRGPAWWELQPRPVDGRPPPHDIEAEQRALGATLAHPGFSEDAFPPLIPEHFFSEAHRQIAEACVGVQLRDGRVDQVAVYELLKDRGRLDQVGGASVLETLVQGAQGSRAATEARAAVNVVWNAFQRRQLALLCQQAQASAYLGGISTRELFAEFEQQVAKLCRAAARANEAPHVSEDLAAFVARITRNELPILIPSGLVAYDAGVDMIRTRELSIVGASTGIGKTSFGVGRLIAAARAGFGGIYFSTEMTREEVIQRMISSESGVPVKLVRRYGALDLYQRPKVLAAADRLRALPMHIEAEPFHQTTQGIRSQIRRLRAAMTAKGIQLRLVVIDYLQDLRLALDRNTTKAQALLDASTDLKIIAAEQDVHIMALVQLTIDDKRPADWEPQLGDIADCKGVSKPASTVTFIHRKPIAKGEKEPDSGPLALLGRKGRNSGRWRRTVLFHGPICRFDDDTSYQEVE